MKEQQSKVLGTQLKFVFLEGETIIIITEISSLGNSVHIMASGLVAKRFLLNFLAFISI